jgi:hypothetical protein
VETEIESIKKLTLLYTNLSTQNPPETLRQHIQNLLASQDLIIFQQKKV